MSDLKSNKSFQFICGVGTLVFAFYLYSNGAFSFLFRDEPEGMESVSLATLLISAAVSTCQMIGIISIGIVSGLLAPLAEWTVDTVRSKFPKVKDAGSRVETVDIDKLLSVLNDLDSRLKKIEDDQP